MFKEMDPDEVWRAIEGHKNILAEETKKVEDYFKKVRCPRCTGSCRPILNNPSLFKENEILPDYLAECVDCGAVYTPYTFIEVSGPTKDPNAD